MSPLLKRNLASYSEGRYLSCKFHRKGSFISLTYRGIVQIVLEVYILLQVCGFRFIQRPNLIMHFRIHNYSQFRTNFLTKVLFPFILNTHLRSYSDQRNFLVNYKEMSFLAESWKRASRQTMENELSRKLCTFQVKLALSTTVWVRRDCLELVVLWMCLVFSVYGIYSTIYMISPHEVPLSDSSLIINVQSFVNLFDILILLQKFTYIWINLRNKLP
jgi:hypothetical protein